MSALDFTSMLSILQSSFDSKLAISIARAKEVQQRESRGMPNSTRRAFLSRMETDARTSRQGAQNMGDASTLLTTAQTGVTAIKHSIAEMNKIAAEAKKTSTLSEEDAAAFTTNLQSYAKYILETAKSTEFNGFKLLDGSNEEFKLHGDNMQITVDMANMLNSDAIANSDNTDPATINKKVTDGGSLNLNNLHDSVVIKGTTDAERITDVQRILDMLDEVTQITTGFESNYSYDIKGVNNFATMLNSQADIFDAVIKNHADPEPPTPAPDSASYLDSLVNGSYSNGNIFSGTS